MSYNVRIFNLYNWHTNVKEKDNILNLIKESRPHIICFQEFFSSDGGTFQLEKQIPEKLGYHYSYFFKTLTLRDTDHWGLAIYSDYPIIATHKIDIPGGRENTCIYADLKINNQTVRVFNMHLQSLYFAKQDYKYLDNISLESDTDLVGARRIVAKIKHAYDRRGRQSDMIQAEINQSPYPVIICGDFNDTPSSYAYNTLGHNLKDAFVEKGNWLGTTYAGPLPWFRIDYIFCSQSLNVQNFEVLKKPYSDHYPIMASFTMP